MPGGSHSVQVDCPIETVWTFVRDINNWAPLVPGYIEHQIINDKQSTWKFVSDIGIIKRTLHMEVDIINWQEPTKVTFNLKGINEKFTGSGYFEAERITESRTKITGYLDIKASGLRGRAINPALKSVIPKTATQLTAAVSNDIQKICS
ncbi:CoxG family protein [Oceanobacillus sp. CF4.6]|uniref:CoxG family protein n=1 Tax=Oceanobacillus sp. CF4.6 TaxID=3373080 RepID=UPI003EE51B82